ncbi:carboxypeptidase regulatory-like domain-containing protein [bacterium]|nr:carboxypeptidase regulatory-like domain-containing protein [bacterium]
MIGHWRIARIRTLAALLFGVVCVGAASASLLGAQQLRGTVLMPDSVTRAPGVIVELLASSGALVERTLTNGRGDFSLTAPGPGRYTARALRVGFRPTLAQAFDLATPSSTATLTMVLNARPVALDAISVVTNDQCHLRPDSGQMVYAVWNEASKALLSSRLSAAGAPLVAEWITYSRVTDPLELRIAEQTVRSTKSVTTTVFRSWDADSLAVNGYLIDRGDSTVFHAPDAQVLLSDVFASGHCLRLQRASADSAALIGVRFEPTTRRDNIYDIAGTFWVDRATAELRALDFSYIGLPKAANDARPGGHVEFTHLTSGNWIVNRWFLRLPQLGSQLRDQHAGNFRTTTNATVLRALRIAGGEVVSITRDGTQLFRGVLPEVRVTIASRDPQHPARDATVTLEGTDYEAHADSAGTVVIPQVLPGTYRALAQTPTMVLALVPPSTRDLAVGAGRIHVKAQHLAVGFHPPVAVPFHREGQQLAVGLVGSLEIEAVEIVDPLERELGDLRREVEASIDSRALSRLLELRIGEMPRAQAALIGQRHRRANEDEQQKAGDPPTVEPPALREQPHGREQRYRVRWRDHLSLAVRPFSVSASAIMRSASRPVLPFASASICIATASSASSAALASRSLPVRS